MKKTVLMTVFFNLHFVKFDYLRGVSGTNLSIEL
jgi:hypothetical protein